MMARFPITPRFAAMIATLSPRPARTFVVACLACIVMAIGNAPARADDDPRFEQLVDESIVKALRYISGKQLASGAWEINSLRAGDRSGDSTAATSLAVMAFLSAGHVPGEGPYGQQINRGIRWVVDNQQADGLIIARRTHGPFYSHGISTLMLAEVAGMVGPELADDTRRALERGIRLTLMAQGVQKRPEHRGGWRYEPTSSDSDLSVTGWQVMSLRAAKNIGCDVPAEAIDEAVAYVKRCCVRRDKGEDEVIRGFAYQPGGEPTPTRSGTGVLALEICGEHHTQEALGAAQSILDRPLHYQDHYFFYGVYYCSLGMFQMGGEYWTATRDHLANVLLKNQNADGSWNAEQGSERSSGSIYCTSMAVLALAVEYQYLPIYQR